MASKKGFTYNAVTDPAPWGAREQALIEALIDCLVSDSIQNADDVLGHKHNRIYADIAGAASALVDATGLFIRADSTNFLSIAKSAHNAIISMMDTGRLSILNAGAGSIVFESSGNLSIGQGLPMGILHVIKSTGTSSQSGENRNVGNTGTGFTRDGTTGPFMLCDGGTLDDDATLDILYQASYDGSFSGILQVFANIGTQDTAIGKFNFRKSCDTFIIESKEDDSIAYSLSDTNGKWCVLVTAQTAGNSSKITLKNRMGSTMRFWYRIDGMQDKL